MADRFSRSAKGAPADAVEGNLCNGREDCVHRCASEGRPDDDGAVRTVRDQPGYGLWAVGRYQAEGPSGLEPRSRAPHRPGMAVAWEIAEAIIALRRERPIGAPRSCGRCCGGVLPNVWPAPSTMGDLLRREGLSGPRRRRRRAVPLTQPFLPVCEPNDRWCIDFKGWFRTADGQRCDPLTLTDAYSRFLIECRIVPPTTEGVRPLAERAFHELGLPRAIRSDNGVPFARGQPGRGLDPALGSLGQARHSSFERIEPGKPQQNGRHERMHGTLKAETSRPPAANPAEQQARFEHFRRDFNYVRPHEALDQNPPASCYSPSPRPYPARVEDPWYDADHAVRRVRSNGEIKWGGDFIFVSEALIGELVGIAETEGRLDRTLRRYRPWAHRSQEQKASPLPCGPAATSSANARTGRRAGAAGAAGAQ